MRQGRVELDHAERLDQPIRLDRDHLPRLAVGELVVAAIVDARRLIAFHPEPKQLIVAAQVDFRPGHGRIAQQPQPPGPLEGHIRPNGREPRHAEPSLRGREGFDPPAVPIDHLDHLFQGGRRRQHARRGTDILPHHVRTLCAAEPEQPRRDNQQKSTPISVHGSLVPISYKAATTGRARIVLSVAFSSPMFATNGRGFVMFATNGRGFILLLNRVVPNPYSNSLANSSWICSTLDASGTTTGT